MERVCGEIRAIADAPFHSALYTGRGVIGLSCDLCGGEGRTESFSLISCGGGMERLRGEIRAIAGRCQ